jgi:hypothetical protein
VKRLRSSCLLAALLASVAGGGAMAQERPADGAGEYRISAPGISPGHWSLDALRRADALGLLEVHLPAHRAVPLEVVERSLREAAAAAPRKAPGLAVLAREWHARLLEEFPGLDRSPVAEDGGAVLLGAGVGAGMEARRGAAAPGLGQFEPHRSGAIPLDDRALLVGSAEATAVLGRHLGLRVAPRASTDVLRLEELELTAGFGGWSASLGRMPLGYAHGVGGGVTLTGHTVLDAVGVQTRTPFRLPWVLGYLGPVSFTTHFARMTEERHLGDPYFWAASGQFQPHRRVTLGVHRAALFGGDHPEEQPVTFRNVVDMLIGRVAGVGFEDQVVSVSGRFHLPTEAVLPLTAYLEWGAEDAAGAWWACRGGCWVSSRQPSLPAGRAGGGGVRALRAVVLQQPAVVPSLVVPRLVGGAGPDARPSAGR